MTTPDAPAKVDIREPTVDALRDQYQHVVQMVAYESQLFWAIMGTFLVAETVLAGFLVQRPTPPTFSGLRLLAAATGAAGCLLWVVAILRSAGYSNLRTHQAKELERRLGYSLFVAGEDFSAGKQVTSDEKPHRHHALARVLTIKQTGVTLALLFGILFVAVLYQELVLLC